MPGVTKHIFNHEICDILSMFNCEIKTIEPLLPKEYSSGDIIALLKEFYPHEWHSVEIKYRAYDVANESYSSLHIEYDITGILNDFIPLESKDLFQCISKWQKNEYHFESSLDYIYLGKNILHLR